RQVQQYGARLEYRDRGTSIGGSMVDNGWDTVVGRHFQEFWLELFALADIDRKNRVRQPRFLKKQGNFVTVGGSPIVQINHADPLCRFRGGCLNVQGLFNIVTQGIGLGG